MFRDKSVIYISLNARFFFYSFASKMPPRRIKLGVLTPSSNTALEPLTQELITAINTQFANDVYITVHFSRFPVTTISLTAAGLAQFDLEVILSAAELLAHASVDVIGFVSSFNTPEYQILHEIESLNHINS